MSSMKVNCVHGYVLMQDSCPMCDHMEETPHKADPAKVKPDWSDKMHRRCRVCSLVPSARIHEGQG